MSVSIDDEAQTRYQGLVMEEVFVMMWCVCDDVMGRKLCSRFVRPDTDP